MNEVTRWQRKRKISVRRHLESPWWPNHRTYIEESQMLRVYKVKIALKSMYPGFGSRHWVARDTGTYITDVSHSSKSLRLEPRD